MKATGIVRRIDDLGRIVIPKEIRRTLRIREGDSLEIFTNHEGGIILKKYSPVMEMRELAQHYADTLAQNTGGVVLITDRDSVIAVSIGGNKEMVEQKISKELGKVISSQKSLTAVAESKDYIPIAREEKKYHTEMICPIVSSGDSIGSVALLSKNAEKKFGATQEALLAFAANFLGRQMEQ